jgi:hypothetical protein
LSRGGSFAFAIDRWPPAFIWFSAPSGTSLSRRGVVLFQLRNRTAGCQLRCIELLSRSQSDRSGIVVATLYQHHAHHLRRISGRIQSHRPPTERMSHQYIRWPHASLVEQCMQFVNDLPYRPRVWTEIAPSRPPHGRTSTQRANVATRGCTRPHSTEKSPTPASRITVGCDGLASPVQ